MSESNEAGNHPWFTVLAATIIVVCLIGGYVWYFNTGPVHAGQVVSVSDYPIHRELSTGSALGGLKGQPDICWELTAYVCMESHPVA